MIKKLLPPSSLKMEVIYPSETAVSLYLAR
jgi:hypothetical protein